MAGIDILDMRPRPPEAERPKTDRLCPAIPSTIGDINPAIRTGSEWRWRSRESRTGGITSVAWQAPGDEGAGGAEAPAALFVDEASRGFCGDGIKSTTHCEEANMTNRIAVYAIASCIALSFLLSHSPQAFRWGTLRPNHICAGRRGEIRLLDRQGDRPGDAVRVPACDRRPRRQ